MYKKRGFSASSLQNMNGNLTLEELTQCSNFKRQRVPETGENCLSIVLSVSWVLSYSPLEAQIGWNCANNSRQLLWLLDGERRAMTEDVLSVTFSIVELSFLLAFHYSSALTHLSGWVSSHRTNEPRRSPWKTLTTAQHNTQLSTDRCLKSISQGPHSLFAPSLFSISFSSKMKE